MSDWRGLTTGIYITTNTVNTLHRQMMGVAIHVRYIHITATAIQYRT